MMNIVKDSETRRLVNFVDPTEYLYGTKFMDVGAEQGGAYNRRIVGVRIENWSDASIEDMHYFYKKMARTDQNHTKTFNLALGPIYNYVRSHTPEGFDVAERGNCARWTSAGLVFGDVLKSNYGKV